jgi:hypothetical protein
MTTVTWWRLGLGWGNDPGLIAMASKARPARPGF